MKVDINEFCLVDQCVLTDGVKVGFLYREAPEPGEPYGDSGWSIRGEASDAGDAEIDKRTIAYVPLAAVLAIDSGWQHLIDSAPGSAFARNPRSMKFEAIDPDAD